MKENNIELKEEILYNEEDDDKTEVAVEQDSKNE